MSTTTPATLEQQVNDALKQAMKDKDQPTADTLRMVKTKIMERRTAAGFSGVVDDALVRDVISAYRKQLAKAVGEFQAAGAQGEEQIAQLHFEMGILDKFLPKRLGDDEVRALVRARIEALGVTDPKQVGRLVGDITKTHKDLVDGAAVKRIADEELAKKPA